MTAGLAKGTVRLVDRDPGWSQLYREARARIEAALGPWLEAIEHVGSTSVRDLVAKPIIDIAARVPAAAR